MNKDIENYFKREYKDQKIVLKDFEDKNYTFDAVMTNGSFNLFIEYKSRYFEMDKNHQFLGDDILIELVQSLKYLSKWNDKVTNRNINAYFNDYALNIAIGWYYKCDADRLVFFRYLDKEPYDVIDIDFIQFRRWLNSQWGKFKLQYSDKTTKTVNAIVNLSDIPKPFYRKFTYME